MKILIVEDEPPIALSIRNSCEAILKENAPKYTIVHTLKEAMYYAENARFDICLLDLNLSGADGFELLKKFTASFYTIIISAYSEKAVEAFEYGVLDFVPKPFHNDRLKKAFGRYFQRSHNFSSKAQYIVVHKQAENQLLSLSDILYFKSVRYLIEIHLLSGQVELIEKPLNQLETILPENFIRIHRSYIVDFTHLQVLKHHMGGRYMARLSTGESIPVSRGQYKMLMGRFNK